MDTRHEKMEKKVQECRNHGKECKVMGDLNNAINEEPTLQKSTASTGRQKGKW